MGYDNLLTPSSFLGAALFGGGEAYATSHVEIKLPKTLDTNEIAASLWFRSSDIMGRRTVLDFSNFYDPNVNKFSLNIDFGIPLLMLHDEERNDKFLFALSKYFLPQSNFTEINLCRSLQRV